MPNLTDTVYCLACRKPMPATEQDCPECGANQAEARAARAASPSRQTARPSARAKDEPEPRTETMPCPHCYTPVEPRETTCRYCGHVMDDPDAHSRWQSGNSRYFVGFGVACLVGGTIGIFTWYVWFLSMIGSFLGYLGMAEDRQNNAAPRVAAGGFVLLTLAFCLRVIVAGWRIRHGA
ncbi:MAG TPA: hypothetical protein VGM37_09650 [Armatimonadota bacterium]